MNAACPDHLGVHLLIDLYGASHLSNLDYIRESCLAAAAATGATILMDNFHPFGEGAGVSGVVLLAESHLSTHTWPEYGAGTFDIYVCGDCDPRLAVPVLRERFSPSEVIVREHHRGDRVRDLQEPPLPCEATLSK